MSQIDLNSVRENLLDRRTRLRRDQGSTLRSVSGTGSPDAVDQAAEATDFVMAVNMAVIGGEELQAIETALAKIDAGTYGHCEECESEINQKRLEALPFAGLCISCQRERELSGVGRRKAFETGPTPIIDV